jgi:AraC-like DNA-binding protein
MVRDGDPRASGPRDTGLSVQYWQPAEALRPFISGYHHYVVELPGGGEFSDVLFPGWANIRFTAPGTRWRIALGRRAFDPVPEQSLFGPTSHAAYSTSGSGTVTGAGITPLGWARLIGADASRFADRILALDALGGFGGAALGEAVTGGDNPAEAFDAFFLERLRASVPVAGSVASIFAAINDPAVASVQQLSDRTGLSGRALIALTKRNFGFPPKMLLRRARFMRALMLLSAVERGRWTEQLGAAGYFDQSHFVKDSRLFLGMPLRSFLALPKPLMELSMRARAEVLGAPAQALHRPG